MVMSSWRSRRTEAVARPGRRRLKCSIFSMAMSMRCISLISRQSFKSSPRTSLSIQPLKKISTPISAKFSAPRQYAQACIPPIKFPSLRPLRLFSTQAEQSDPQEGSLLRSLKTSQNVYEKDISKWEELSTLLIKIGMYYESLQKEEKAEEFFRRAVQLYELHSPSSAAAHVILGNTLSRLDKLEEARDVFGRAVQKLETRAAELAAASSASASSSSSSSSSLNFSKVVGGDVVEDHSHHHLKHDANHDVKIGLVHAYDGLIKSQMRFEGIPSAIPLIRLKLLPALKQLDARLRVETLHEWLKISLAAQREIVELQTVPGIGDFALATEISTLLLSSLEEVQHSHGVLLDVLLDRASIQFSQSKFSESRMSVEKAIDVWRQHVRSSTSEEIRNAVDLQLIVMLARRYHAASLHLSSDRLQRETDRLAQLNEQRRAQKALEPEIKAALAAGENVIPSLAQPRTVAELPEGAEPVIEEGREISDVDSSGESQYESAIRFYSELERKSATRLQSPLSDLYVTALVGLYHLLVEREWFFQGEKNPRALEILQRLREFDVRQISTHDPLSISAFFVTEAVRFHSTSSPELFSLRLALNARRSGEFYLELSSPDYPNQILYKSPLTLQQNKLFVIELNDLHLVRHESPQMTEFHMEIFESRAKAKRLAIHKEFVVPTLDLVANPQQQQSSSTTLETIAGVAKTTN